METERLLPVDFSGELEPSPVHIEWIHTGNGSIYAGERVYGGNILIGGSIWDRRHTPFTPVARESPGLVYGLREMDGIVSQLDGSFVTFPSMVNAIVPAGEATVICCKHGEGTFTRRNRDGEVTLQRDDAMGDGVYSALYDATRSTIIATTRNGFLEFIDPDSLNPVRIIQLTDTDTRLWSLSISNSSGLVAAGDYSGRLFLLDGETDIVKQTDLAALAAPEIPDEKRQYQPSVFGLTVVCDETIVAGIRWGQINWLDRDLMSQKSVFIPWEISYLQAVPNSKDLLIGTRQGKLLFLKDAGESMSVWSIYEIAPSFQTDNSIWSISFSDERHCLVCFADGQVVSVAFNKN